MGNLFHADSFLCSAKLINYSDKNILITGYFDGKIRLWDFDSKECISTMNFHSDWIMGIFIIDKNNILILILFGQNTQMATFCCNYLVTSKVLWNEELVIQSFSI